MPADSRSIPVAVVGPTGYTGLELVEILARHPNLRCAYLASARVPAPRIDDEFPRLKARLARAVHDCSDIDPHKMNAAGVALAFLCLPHEAAMEHTPALLRAGIKVVDLSAAYRILNPSVYQRAYAHHHTDLDNLAAAVYGLTEFARDQVRAAHLVANPGCYPTAAALALIPFIRSGLIRTDSIIINAASGVSGAGRTPKPNLHFPEANENFSAYAVGVHRHQPEIGQSLRRWGLRPFGSDEIAPGFDGMADPLFVPHLLPIERGILETIYASPISSSFTTDDARAVLDDAYKNEPFVVVRDDAPSLRDVNRTNMVHINARVTECFLGDACTSRRLVIVAAEDNLVKGASGQAVQNANLMLGLDETAGLL